MAVKLEGLSAKELQALISEANSRMASARSEQVANARSKIDAMLKAEGLSMGDVFPARGGKVGKRAGAGVPKYRNPVNSMETWTGFGKKPKWFVAAIAKPGITADSLLIDKNAASAKKVAKTPVKKATAKKSAKKAASKKSAS